MVRLGKETGLSNERRERLNTLDAGVHCGITPKTQLVKQEREEPKRLPSRGSESLSKA
jgi:hypothetical protein